MEIGWGPISGPQEGIAGGRASRSASITGAPGRTPESVGDFGGTGQTGLRSTNIYIVRAHAWVAR